MRPSKRLISISLNTTASQTDAPELRRGPRKPAGSYGIRESPVDRGTCGRAGRKLKSKMTNTEKLESMVGKAQKARSAFLTEVQSLSQAEFDFKPAPDAWSIGEVIHHVVLSEEHWQRTMTELFKIGEGRGRATKRIAFGELAMGPRMIPMPLLRFPGFLIPWSIMADFVPNGVQSFILANPIFKVRTAPDVEPKPGMPREELLNYLERSRRSTLQILEPHKNKDLSGFIWKHDLMGSRDVYATLEMLANHDCRHQTQIRNIKNNPRFP